MLPPTFLTPMNVPHFSTACGALLAVAFTAATPLRAQNAVPLDQKDMAEAEGLAAAGKYPEALKLYEGIAAKYPTSAYIPGANLGAAICYFYLKDYEKAVKAAEVNKNLKTPPPPEILERVFLLIPQIYVTQAVGMKEEDPLRKVTLQNAIKAFDDLIKKFPTGDEVESAFYGKGRAQLLTGDYEAAADSFRNNVTKFPNSPSMLDSQYLLANALYYKAIKTLNNTGTADQTIGPTFEEAEKYLRDIVTRNTDLALGNRARFVLGDTLAARASIAKKETGDQAKLQKLALDTYRVVAPKNVVIAAQDQRIKYFDSLRIQAGQQGKGAEMRRYTRMIDKEKEKLETINGEADQSIAAKVKSGQIFVALGRFDEARVLLKFALGFVDDSEEGKEQKKQLQYFITVTYAAQHIADKALENFKAFTEAHPKDPIAESLDLLMGGIYLDPDPKINSPDTAIKYFDQQVAEYPNSKYSAEAVMQKALALIQLKKFDDGVAALTQFINTNKNPELLAQAEYNLAIAYLQNNQLDQAAAAFKTVRDKYKTAQQAEEAAFWLGQILYTKNDYKTALTELDTFVGKNPNSELVPQAHYFKAKALYALGKKPEAFAAYKKISDEFPQSEVAIPAYFERAKALQDDGKLDDAIAVMREFIAAFPKEPKIYSAFDYIAQILSGPGKKKPMDAIKVYEEYIAAYPDDTAGARAYVAIANIWKREAEGIGTFLSISEADKGRWKEAMGNAIKSAESAITTYPESDAVSAALQVLLGVQQVQQAVNIIKADEVKAYFIGLAKKFEGKSTKSKILFAVAGFIAPKDPEGAFSMMGGAYDDKLLYAPEDLDLYGNSLIDHKKLEDADKIFTKLLKDYPIPAGTAPDKVGRTVGNAQSVVLAGKARIDQAKGQAAEGQKKLEDLKRLYPWSGKVAEADYGIGAGLFEQKKYEEAIEILSKVARNNAANVHLRAMSMMTIAKAQESLKSFSEAINNYVKIGILFESERELAAEGFWLGAQLMEKQVTGEIKKPTPPPAAAAKPADAAPKPGTAPKKSGEAAPKPATAPAPVKA